MKFPSTVMALLGTALLCAGTCRAAPPAADLRARFSPPSTDISPLDDLTRAKMDLQQTQINRDTGLWNSDDNSDSAQCGTVTIGSTPSTTNQGTSRVLPGSTTVIVTGSIVNSANCGN